MAWISRRKCPPHSLPHNHIWLASGTFICNSCHYVLLPSEEDDKALEYLFETETVLVAMEIDVSKRRSAFYRWAIGKQVWPAV